MASNNDQLIYGVAALGRPTFDVPFAEEMLERAFAALDAAGIMTVGPRTLLYDADAAEKAFADIEAAGQIDALLILQITFTDATMTVSLAKRSAAPIAIWAVPEPRLGGRLRLNAFCGLNLAAHALGKANVAHSWLYAAPDAPNLTEDLRALSTPVEIKSSAAQQLERAPSEETAVILSRLRDSKISVIGQHPDGFDTCEFDAGDLKTLADVKVEQFDLEGVFEAAKNIDAPRVADVKAQVAGSLAKLDEVDQAQLDRSFRLFCAFEDLQKASGADGLAVRCWPETFTEYGCAACGPMAMMNQKCVPSACEADVYGSFSALMLQSIVEEPVWMADLVDLDFADNTGVFWHCGLAPLTMCDPDAQPEATIHTNRKMPLLHQFPLKPGVFTIARVSQSRDNPKLVIGQGEFIRRPMAFTGTSGVATFDVSAHAFCETVMAEALEHHYAIAYGDHRETLREIGTALDLPVLELTP
ncbi:MAG: hypothetical protein AAFR21_10320 [Pseudomonadota bacterium]